MCGSENFEGVDSIVCVLGIPTKVLRLDNKHLYPQSHRHTQAHHTHTQHTYPQYTQHTTQHTLPLNYLNIVLFVKIADFFFSVETITVVMDP